jgi:signal transduction histidine kinase
MPTPNSTQTTANFRSRLSPETLASLRHVTIFASLDDAGLRCLDFAEEVHLERDEIVIRQGDLSSSFWILLEGTIRIFVPQPNGFEQIQHVLEPGVSFGEVTLLASMPAPANLRAAEPCRLLRLSEDNFWDLMNQCPGVRKAILRDMALRLGKVQQATFQQEKMAALGTLAAGLMHELNNPGAAARRASTQLRDNLMRMHRLAGKFSKSSLSDEQKECMFGLQELALAAPTAPTMSSLDQSDAEEALAEWMDSVEIEDAWKLAPTLVSIGIDACALACARETFTGPIFSDAISWLEALVSSMQLVGTIEESIGRVTELVSAVKSYAYEGRGQKQKLDVNRSILATLIIVGHKMREKQITVDKHLASDLPLLETDCQGLNQIWTNLLDNAIDAAPQGGRIGIKTWMEKHESEQELFILVSDNGSGIPLENQTHIFDPFYTTKPVGVGTGLGLGIVHRIVDQFGGSVRFSSAPGETEFVVRLPNRIALAENNDNRQHG